MKILFVINGMSRGGAERQLANLLEPLAELGVKSYLATLKPDRSYDDQVIPFVVRYESGLLKRSRLLAFPRLIMLARSVDAVVTYLPWSDVVGRLAALIARRPVFTVFQSTVYDPKNVDPLPAIAKRKIRFVKLLDALTIRIARGVFAVSVATRDVYARELRIAPTGIEVLPNAVDLKNFDPAARGDRAAVRAALGWPPDELALLAVARFFPQKDHATAIAAVAEVAPDLPMRLYLAGGGPEEDRLRALTRDLKAPVSFLGVRDDIPRLLSAADLFLLPTFFEGMPLALLEAMAMGLPCVCSDIPENVETAGHAARYAAPGDVAAWVQCLREVGADADLRQRLGHRARERAHIFDARDVAARFLAALKRAM